MREKSPFPRYLGCRGEGRVAGGRGEHHEEGRGGVPGGQERARFPGVLLNFGNILKTCLESANIFP